MVKLFRILAVLVAMTTCCSMSADPSLSMEDITTTTDKATLNVSMSNPGVPVMYVQCDIKLPEGITISTDSSSEPIVNLSDRFDNTYDGQASWIPTEEEYRVFIYSSKNHHIIGEEGLIFSVPLDVTCALGTYDITLCDINLTLPDGNSGYFDIPAADAVATITVEEPVVKQKDKISWSIDLSDYEFETQYLLSATSESGLPITYTLDILEGNTTQDEESAEITSGGRNKKYLVIYEDCLINLTASTAGNDEYKPASMTYQIRFANGKCTECDIIGASSIELVDGTPYTNDTDEVYETITYTRSCGNTAWKALYLPFDIPYEVWSELGDIVEFTGATPLDRDGDGINEGATLEFKRVNTAYANTPYLFRPKVVGDATFTVSDATLHAATEASVSHSTDEYTITIYGNYENKSGLYGMGAYALSTEGQLVPAESSDQILKPYRIYMTAKANNGHASAPAVISVTVDGEVSGIEDIEIIQQIDGRCYDLLGREIANPQHGLYIRGGQKVIVR